MPEPWQTCTCIGSWHYDRPLYERRGYKSAKSVVQRLCDIVSKNGNLLLSIPQRGDGSIDDQEETILRRYRQLDAAPMAPRYTARGRGGSSAKGRPGSMPAS